MFLIFCRVYNCLAMAERVHHHEAPINLHQTTFHKLGIVDERKASEGTPTYNRIFGIRIVPSPQETIFIALLDQPFAHNQLANLANNVAPFKTAQSETTKYNMEADLRMPVAVAEGTSRDPSLHYDHLSDPVIGATYQDFTTHHNENWLRALNKEFDYIEFLIENVHFIDSDRLTARVFKERLQHLSILEGSRYPQTDSGASELAHFGRALLLQSSPEKFIGFLSSHVEAEDIPAGRELDDLYFLLPRARKIALLREYLEQLNESDQREFALNYVVDDHNILVDLAKGEVRIEQVQGYLDDVGVTILSDSTIRITDKFGPLEVEVVITTDAYTGDNGENAWEIKRVQSNIVPEQNPLYPLIAWQRNTDGTRRFLSQEETMAMLPKELPNSQKGDVFLGRVLAAYFTPEITKNWPTRMFLAHRMGVNPEGQKMMAAQVAAWTSIDAHAQQLLSNVTSPIRLLETFLEK